jgi:hypothetical protein
MLSVQHNFLFIHVPKTAGNAIQNILRDYSEAQIETDHEIADGKDEFGVTDPKYGTTKHATLAEYRSVVEPEIYRQLFKFAVVRNPWERMISGYFSPYRGDVEWDEDSFRKYVLDRPPIRHYITEKKALNNIASKVSYIAPSISCIIKPLDKDLDFVLRFENLEGDFKSLCSHLGIPHQSLPVRNRSGRNHYSSYYTDRLRRLVKKKFSEEIHFFSYSFKKNKGEFRV